MNNGRTVIDYFFDLVYGATRYSNGWLNPNVYRGYFSNDEAGRKQRIFFNILLLSGFRRTPWQLVFPGQTAGLVKKIEPTPGDSNEYHVRFYDDGTVDCELEFDRFDGGHWTGSRKHGVELLERILDDEIDHLPRDTRDAIIGLFEMKPYSNGCIRK